MYFPLSAPCKPTHFLRIVFSGILRRVALVRADVSEEFSSYLMRGIRSSPETSVLIRATRRNILEDAILHSHRRENLKSYIALTGWTL
jgi:hypothetical protein